MTGLVLYLSLQTKAKPQLGTHVVTLFGPEFVVDFVLVEAEQVDPGRGKRDPHPRPKKLYLGAFSTCLCAARACMEKSGLCEVQTCITSPHIGMPTQGFTKKVTKK